MLSENDIIVYITDKYGGMLIDSSEGISAEGIKLALTLEEIENKPLITQKLIVYLQEALKTQRQMEIKNGKKDKVSLTG